MKKLLLATTGFVAMTMVGLAQNSSPQNAAYKNKSLPVEKRVADLLSRMTLEEKAGQLNQLNGGVFTGPAANDPGQKAKMEMVRKGQVGSMLNVTGAEETRVIQELAMKENRLGIPLIFAYDVIHGYKTIFPIPLADACAWDAKLSEKAASIAAKEASAEGLHWTFAPMMDISHDPRWGRVMEGGGEDPYLGGVIAAARVKGFQGSFGKDNLLACVKHFGVYGAVEGGREYNHVNVDRYHAFNFYLPPYKAAIEAGAATVMNSFNVFEAVPASGNAFLVNDVLKKQWGFKGFLVSDWNSFGEMIIHGYAKDNKDAAMKAINAGSMIDMETRAMVSEIPGLVKEGKVSIQTLNDAVSRILTYKFKLGLFDDPFRNCDPERQKNNVFTAEHRKASREAGQKSIVLLKNNGAALPLSASAKIALVGNLAASVDDMFDFWVANAKSAAYNPVTVLEGLKNAGANVQFAKGYNDAFETSPALIDEAKSAAASADVIVVNIGISGKMAGEDRSIAMPEIADGQIELLKALKQTGKKVIALVSSGRPLVLTKAEPYCDAIVYTWILGTEHGNAVADVLFGAANPSAKTAMSFPYSVGQIPVYYNHMNTSRPDPTDGAGNWYSRYRDIPNDPLYPFGFGLSYTTFAYSNLQLSKASMAAAETVTASVTVKNTGAKAGEEIVQLYIRDLVSNRVRPVKELKGFEKITLQPGEQKTVSFKINKALLSYLDETGKPQIEPGAFHIFVGGSSKDVLQANLELK
ncbi:MAG TPA: beta-glucosidase BglX [Phnomibacter sp.]|nr:beta-glucosidase BglX [Phnomibacter sp.]